MSVMDGDLVGVPDQDMATVSVADRGQADLLEDLQLVELDESRPRRQILPLSHPLHVLLPILAEKALQPLARRDRRDRPIVVLGEHGRESLVRNRRRNRVRIREQRGRELVEPRDALRTNVVAHAQLQRAADRRHARLLVEIEGLDQRRAAQQTDFVLEDDLQPGLVEATGQLDEGLVGGRVVVEDLFDGLPPGRWQAQGKEVQHRRVQRLGERAE
jgi:hypothetical protein